MSPAAGNGVGEAERRRRIHAPFLSQRGTGFGPLVDRYRVKAGPPASWTPSQARR